jgi:lysozyme family protein
MLTINSPIFQEYAKHILKSEGKTTNNPKDTTAAKMVPAGAIHTNRGVTWYVYRDNAKKLGLNPSYENFVKMYDADAIKFVYLYYTQNAAGLPPLSSIAVTESAWASGSHRSKLNLIAALKTFGLNVANYNSAVIASKKIDDKKLALEIVNQQQQFYKTLATGNPEKYGSFLKGWTNRSNRLLKIVQDAKAGTPFILIGLFIAAYFYFRK